MDSLCPQLFRLLTVDASVLHTAYREYPPELTLRHEARLVFLRCSGLGNRRSLGTRESLLRSIRPTQVRNLVRPGVNLDMAIKHAISRKNYWRLSRTPAMRYAMPNKWLEQLGLLSLKQLWCNLAPLRGAS